AALIDDDRTHADNRTVGVFTFGRFWRACLRRIFFSVHESDETLLFSSTTIHDREKKDRGCTSTNFHLPATWTTVKVSRSFLRAGAPPLAGAASISASTARFALSPSKDVSIKLSWTRMDSVWPKNELIC